jgi:hypothetical protein
LTHSCFRDAAFSVARRPMSRESLAPDDAAGALDGVMAQQIAL